MCSFRTKQTESNGKHEQQIQAIVCVFEDKVEFPKTVTRISQILGAMLEDKRARDRELKYVLVTIGGSFVALPCKTDYVIFGVYTGVQHPESDA